VAEALILDSEALNALAHPTARGVLATSTIRPKARAKRAERQRRVCIGWANGSAAEICDRAAASADLCRPARVAWPDMAKTPRSSSLLSSVLLAKLGPSFRAVKSNRRDTAFVQVEHVPSQTLFVLIPGGVFQMGVSAGEIAALGKLTFNEEVTREQVARMARTQTRKTKVAPFLCARAAVSGALAERVLGDMGWTIDEDEPEKGIVRLDARQAGKLARTFAKDGLRLITEPEWEWVAREGGARIWLNANDARGAERACDALYRKPRFERAAGPPATNGFGVWGLPFGDFVAAPSGTRRTVWGVRGGAAMLYPWQTDEIVMCVPSFGYRLGKSKQKCGVRFAVDLPR